MDINQIIQHAINLIEAGEKNEGRDLLKQAILAEPDNPDAWFVYAQYCGKREQAIDSLQRVLMLDPYYPNARDLLERISPPAPQAPALKPQPQLEPAEAWENSPQPQTTEQKKSSAKKKKSKIPRSLLYTGIGVTVCLCVGISGIAVTALISNINAAPPAAATMQANGVSTPGVTEVPSATATHYVYKSPTPTPDPCTCEAVNAYMEKFVPRVDRMLAEMDSMTEKMDRGSFTPQDATIISQSATNLYQDQRAEIAPYCVESFQKDAMQMFWTWDQATKSITNQDVNGALGFMQVIVEDSKQIDEKMEKLFANPKLQGCNLTFPTPVIPED